jgi:hypothetical protein
MTTQQLSSLSKERLINMIRSKEYQRKSAWRTYYDLLEDHHHLHTHVIAVMKQVTTSAENNIPTHFINEFKEILDKYEHVYQCAVCMDEMDTKSLYIIPSCGHKFHKDCIDEWKKRKSECPTCRKPMK